MSTYNEVTPARVAVGQPLSTALMSDLANNPIGIIQRASGAPKILGVPYNVQIFAASGTWTKPANAESGDVVIVWGVGGGASGAADTTGSEAGGGDGGFGAMYRFDDIDDLAATMAVAIGAGAAVNTSGDGSDGGLTRLGGTGVNGYISFPGGQAGRDNGQSTDDRFFIQRVAGVNVNYFVGDAGKGGIGSAENKGQPSLYGGGGGGAGQANSNGGFSGVGGHGGAGATGETGLFPGGGGGGVDSDLAGGGGGGGDGYLIVYCIKET